MLNYCLQRGKLKRLHFLTNKILFKLHYNRYHSFIKFLILLLTQGYVYLFFQSHKSHCHNIVCIGEVL